jgi:hypothetical protein
VGASNAPDRAGVAEWTADAPFPQFVIGRLLGCGSSKRPTTTRPNLSAFCADGINQRLDQADATNASAGAWEGIDLALERQSPWAPLVDLNWLDVVSPSLHDYTYNRAIGPLLDQMWVQH